MADDNSDLLSQLRIAKNAYIFNLRRRYTPVSHYQIKKSKADTPLGKFVEGLRPQNAPLSRASYGKGGKGALKPSSAPMLRTIAGTAIAASLILMLLLAWFVVTFRPPVSGAQPPGPIPAFNGTIDVRMQNASLITYGPESPSQVQPYVLFDFAANSVKHLDVDARVYASPPSRQVFVLRYAHTMADIYPSFHDSLQTNLHDRGWSLQDIGPEDLATLPGGCTLIVPTGYLPAPLLGDTQNITPSIIDLARRGIVVIYIGLPFDQQVLGPDGVYFPPDPNLSARTGITFDTGARPYPTDGLRLSQPIYRAAWRGGGGDMLWGSISQLSVGSGSGAGFLLLVPESLDGGWPGAGASAGEDIARLVADEPYRPALSSTTWSSDGPFNDVQRVTLLLSPLSPTSGGTLRLRFILNDTNGLSEQLVTDWPIAKTAAGDLYFDNSVLLPTSLGGTPQPVRAYLRETSNKPVKLSFELVSNGTVQDRQALENGLTQPNGLKPATYAVSAGPGTYLLRLSDPTGRVYAATALTVVGLSISTPRPNSAVYNSQFQTGAFNFSFALNGQAARVPDVKVQMQGSSNAPVEEFRDTDTVTYTWARDYPRGNYTFLFDFGNGYTQQIVLPRQLTVNFWERPEIIGMAILSAFIFGLAFYLRRPEVPLFSLDIPDFPPKSVTKIPMASSKVLGLFEQINRDYAWEHMPLRTEELKGGFRKMLYNGKPVVIGDYNLQRLLELMAERKLVGSAMGYWAPISWVAESGQTLERLCMFRNLRDLFVTGAVRFSRLGALPNCDVKILIGSEEYYLHFYLGDEAVVNRALQTISLGRTWILFRDEFERDAFMEHLHSSAAAPLALKMQVYDKRARLFTLAEMPGVLKRLKVE